MATEVRIINAFIWASCEMNRQRRAGPFHSRGFRWSCFDTCCRLLNHDVFCKRFRCDAFKEANEEMETSFKGWFRRCDTGFSKETSQKLSINILWSTNRTYRRTCEWYRLMCNSAPWTETHIYRRNKEPTDAEVESFITRLFGILDSDWSAAPFIYFRLMTMVTV